VVAVIVVPLADDCCCRRSTEGVAVDATFAEQVEVSPVPTRLIEIDQVILCRFDIAVLKSWIQKYVCHAVTLPC